MPPNSPQWAIGSTNRKRSADRPLLPPRKRAILTRRLWFQLDESRGSEHRKYDPTGAIATLDDPGVSFDTGAWYLARLRLEGDLIRAKVWAGLVFADEPADWMFSAQDSDFTDGYVGVGLRTDTGGRFMDFFFAENLD